MTREDLKKACNFWVTKGVLVEKSSQHLSVNQNEVVFETVQVLIQNQEYEDDKSDSDEDLSSIFVQEKVGLNQLSGRKNVLNEKQKMIQNFALTIIGVSNQHQHLANSHQSSGGKTFETIFSMLTTVYMQN